MKNLFWYKIVQSTDKAAKTKSSILCRFVNKSLKVKFQISDCYTFGTKSNKRIIYTKHTHV